MLAGHSRELAIIIDYHLSLLVNSPLLPLALAFPFRLLLMIAQKRFLSLSLRLVGQPAVQLAIAAYLSLELVFTQSRLRARSQSQIYSSPIKLKAQVPDSQRASQSVSRVSYR